MRTDILLGLLLAAAAGNAWAEGLETSGLGKLNLLAATYPDDSLVREVIGASSVDVQGEFRLNLEWRRDDFSAEAAYQAFGFYGDTLELGNRLPPGVGVVIPRLPDDSRRLFDLTRIVSDGGKRALLHRFDRAWVGHSGEHHVVRIGRQALTWGNGLFYAPMDLVNPFDPATIDTEYKFGDDMLYGQYLRDNGDDLQAAVVLRRDPLSGDVEDSQRTIALKYHGFAASFEYDLLLADHYDDQVLGLGASADAAGAVLRSDLVISDTPTGTFAQWVVNASYSWVMGGRNVSGSLEYLYNGFGQADGDYSPDALAANPELTERVLRRQLFTLGRHYIAASAMVEVTPLWTVTPIVLANVGDPSALIQLTSRLSLGDNLTLLGSINLPVGPSGSEFGGISTGIDDSFLSSGPGVFAQLAAYF
ncbi:MAG: hypothetical protein AAFX10_14920 [Pseudomonadota bacterium]